MLFCCGSDEGIQCRPLRLDTCHAMNTFFHAAPFVTCFQKLAGTRRFFLCKFLLYRRCFSLAWIAIGFSMKSDIPDIGSHFRTDHTAMCVVGSILSDRHTLLHTHTHTHTHSERMWLLCSRKCWVYNGRFYQAENVFPHDDIFSPSLSYVQKCDVCYVYLFIFVAIIAGLPKLGVVNKCP